MERWGVRSEEVGSRESVEREREREREHERSLLTSRKISPVSRLMTVTL